MSSNVVIIIYSCAILGTALAILILPFDAATNLDTTASTYITPRPYIVIIISLVIGQLFIISLVFSQIILSLLSLTNFASCNSTIS